MTPEYDRDIAVRATRPDAYDAELSDGWRVGGGLNGGYLLAVIGSALRHALPEAPDPLTITAHYLTAAAAGPAEVEVERERTGSSVATARATLRQGDRATVAALATCGRIADLPDDTQTTAVEIELPPREQCLGTDLAPADFRAVAPFLDRFELLLDPACAGWAMGQPSGRGLLQGWFRLADGREPDPLSLLTVIDALPPVSFDLGRPGWAPTLSLTAHLRALPAPGWLKVRHSTRNVAGGMFEEDCEVWDAGGRLVAQARQLARLPRS